MAGAYAIKGIVAVAGDSMLTLEGSTTERAKLLYLAICSETAPLDTQVHMEVGHADGTVAPIGTAVTPAPLDPADIAAKMTSEQTMTTEPTVYGIPLLNVGIYQRSHYQFYPREGSEFVTAATANAVLGSRIITFSAGTPTMSTVMHFQE